MIEESKTEGTAPPSPGPKRLRVDLRMVITLASALGAAALGLLGGGWTARAEVRSIATEAGRDAARAEVTSALQPLAGLPMRADALENGMRVLNANVADTQIEVIGLRRDFQTVFADQLRAKRDAGQ